MSKYVYCTCGIDTDKYSRQQRETLKERDAMAFDSEEAVKKREQAAEERMRQSVNMVGESIKRGMEESDLL